MNTGPAYERVSAADFIRGFASWRLHSARQPVVVTHHGKDAHVLISLDQYRRMGGAGDGPSASAQLAQSQILLLESVRDGLILIDRERRIAALNPAASDMVERAASSLIGQSLAAALPGIETSLIFHHIQRMIDHRERFSGDLPSLLRPGQWLHADLIPLPVGGAIILRDVSEAMAALEASDARAAALRALDTDGGIGRAAISLREAVEQANDTLAAMLGVSGEAIRRVKFSALLAVARRAQFSEALEDVLRAGRPVRIESDLVVRDGAIVPVTLSIAERRNAYFSDGAVVLVTRR
ncbi:PAS domain-containing protein [Sphingopyxis sp. PET50]|uniref:PAS domain-containing protein n=1 Tax=Sphingopyxis sp. PET50 TaxID=2976533 RepID=UPI0021AEA13D|nr:PAS domain-containing protein [Sphingopyxis sp. PET50]